MRALSRHARLAIAMGVIVLTSSVAPLNAPDDPPAAASEPRSAAAVANEPPGPPEVVDRPVDVGPEEPTPEPPAPRLRSGMTAPLRPRVHDAPLPARTDDPPTARRARLRVDGLAPDALARTLATDGVAFATTVYTAEVPVEANGSTVALRVAFVDPEPFRVFTPAVTNRPHEIWQRIAAGEVALTHDKGRLLGAQPGDAIRVGGIAGATVGGWLSLGYAGVADVVMRADLAPAVTAGGPAEPLLLVALRAADLGPAVAARLAEAGVGQPTELADQVPYRAWLVGDDQATVEAFGEFTFHPRKGGGMIDIDPAWVAANIVETDVPILGTVKCHRLILPQMHAALTEIVERGLAGLLDPGDYGGCWVPRHIDWQQGRNLSMHAWGVGFDVNVATNGLGKVPQLDPRIVEVFARYGFNWGGTWRRPDGMHFELSRLMDPAEVAEILVAATADGPPVD